MKNIKRYQKYILENSKEPRANEVHDQAISLQDCALDHKKKRVDDQQDVMNAKRVFLHLGGGIGSEEALRPCTVCNVFGRARERFFSTKGPSAAQLAARLRATLFRCGRICLRTARRTAIDPP